MARHTCTKDTPETSALLRTSLISVQNWALQRFAATRNVAQHETSSCASMVSMLKLAASSHLRAKSASTMQYSVQCIGSYLCTNSARKQAPYHFLFWQFGSSREAARVQDKGMAYLQHGHVRLSGTVPEDRGFRDIIMAPKRIQGRQPDALTTVKNKLADAGYITWKLTRCAF